MTRKLGWIVLTLCVSLSASAAVNPSSISGCVRNSSGVPQMGAAVEILASAAAQGLVVYTDAKGNYTASGLLPGTYTVRVSAPSFLPSVRERIGLSSGATLVINVTLNTLFEAIQLVPKGPNTAEDQDDWRWTLRSVANRPILRLADDGLVVVRRSDEAKDGVLKAKVAFLAGSDGEAFSGSDMSTLVQWEQSVFSTGKLGFNGNLGYGAGTPMNFRATYTHEMPNGSRPEIALTVKRFATPEVAARHAALQALALSMADSTAIGNLELRYGGEMQTIQFAGRSTAFRPFGSADYHVSSDTVVGYRYSSSVPNMRQEKGFDTAPADLSESGPRVSLVGGSPALERAAHHEVSVSHRRGKNSVQLAAYRDTVRNVALTGVGRDVDEDGAVPDIYSGSFLYNGGDFSTAGFRAVYERQLMEGTTATVDYSYGGVLTAPEFAMALPDVRANLKTSNRHSVATKLKTTIKPSRTRVIASYRWTDAEALTPVDMFNASAGQTDPYLNLFVKQPLPDRKFIPNGLEALVDIRNLLAEGYRPVVSQDGQAIYLVQAARSVRGGLSYTF
ncbi:MAG TPA: TonB-dependent receptor [Clostridia bacterium]|nr:TonB-dependent receptor [Clostridia bacterium]